MIPRNLIHIIILKFQWIVLAQLMGILHACDAMTLQTIISYITLFGAQTDKKSFSEHNDLQDSALIGIMHSILDLWDFFREITVVSASLKSCINYPNPFNPATEIKFNLPKDVNVSIKVYDMIGNGLVKLVEEYKKAGSYSIDFNGTNLASGVYFYRIQAGDLVQSKKMILVKQEFLF